MKASTALLSLWLLAGPPVLAAADAPAVTPDQTRSEVTALLREFLAHVDEAAMHDRFWAADLIYTAGTGMVRTKADILQGLAARTADPAKPREPAPAYTAEDIIVRPYGDMAALTFRLVAHTPDGKTGYFRNSGTFIRRDGRWQVVTWQATPVPPAGEKPAN
jgi:Domain of unknown function (DUF4440)